MSSFENTLPSGFYEPLSKRVVTIKAAKKSMIVRGKYVYNTKVIYDRVLGLQQSLDIGIQDVIRHELAPFPSSLFKETGDVRLSTGKCVLKNKPKVPYLPGMSSQTQ